MCVLCTKTKNNILELESSISSTFVAEHGVLKQLLCLTTSHYTKRTNRCYSVQAVCAAQKYLRGPAAPMRSSSSTVNKLPQTLGLCRCGLPFFVPIQMYCMFFAGLWFRHGEIRAKTRKKTNAKEKSRSFTLWSYKSRSPFCFPPFRGGSELSLSFKWSIAECRNATSFDSCILGCLVNLIYLAICQWTAMPNINCHSRYGGFLSTAWSQKASLSGWIWK